MVTTIGNFQPQDPFFDPYNSAQNSLTETMHPCMANTPMQEKNNTTFSNQDPSSDPSGPLDGKPSVEILEVEPSQEPIDVVENELNKVTEMLKNPNPDIRALIDQFCRIAMALHRQGALDNKVYALDKELELTFEITKVKNTYNDWKVLAVTIVSGGLTVLGGVVGLAGTLPGTMAGQALANMAPKAFALFNNANATKSFNYFSQAMGSIGQGTGSFGKLFESRAEAERAVHQFILNQGQSKLGDRNQASMSEIQLCRETLRKAEATDSEAHQTIKWLLESSAR